MARSINYQKGIDDYLQFVEDTISSLHTDKTANNGWINVDSEHSNVCAFVFDNAELHDKNDFCYYVRLLITVRTKKKRFMKEHESVLPFRLFFPCVLDANGQLGTANGDPVLIYDEGAVRHFIFIRNDRLVHATALMANGKYQANIENHTDNINNLSISDVFVAQIPGLLFAISPELYLFLLESDVDNDCHKTGIDYEEHEETESDPDFFKSFIRQLADMPSFTENKEYNYKLLYDAIVVRKFCNTPFEIIEKRVNMRTNSLPRWHNNNREYYLESYDHTIVEDKDVLEHLYIVISKAISERGMLVPEYISTAITKSLFPIEVKIGYLVSLLMLCEMYDLFRICKLFIKQ